MGGKHANMSNPQRRILADAGAGYCAVGKVAMGGEGSSDNLREADTLAQMGLMVQDIEGKRLLTYVALKQPNGLPSGAEA